MLDLKVAFFVERSGQPQDVGRVERRGHSLAFIPAAK
jgi:hypothetical protein